MKQSDQASLFSLSYITPVLHSKALEINLAKMEIFLELKGGKR